MEHDTTRTIHANYGNTLPKSYVTSEQGIATSTYHYYRFDVVYISTSAFAIILIHPSDCAPESAAYICICTEKILVVH